MSDQNCPNCGNPVTEFVNIDDALRSKLKEEGKGDNIPSRVCANCFAGLAGSVARGSVLLAREKAREKKKVMLWKSRVNLIKKARQCMTDKMFSDAAVTYEKYLKVLEIVFDCKAGELTPEMFKDSARTQELTVVASVYWDLLRIYDTSEKYGERMNIAAKKLASFLRFTPIYPDIIRKAEAFSRSAKNPAVVKNFLKLAGEDRGRCFIATSAFESPFAPEVLALAKFRDETLVNSVAGRSLIQTYYFISPPIAKFLDNTIVLKPFVRTILRVLASFLDPASRQ